MDSWIRLCRKHLAQAEHHVALGQRAVQDQREVIVSLARDGHRTETAVRLLGVYEHLLDLHIQDRDRLKAALPREEAGQPTNGRPRSGWSRDTQK